MNRQAYRGCVSACAFALLAWATTVGAKTLSVDSGGKAGFRSIAAAVDAAANGDIIVIEPGVYGPGVVLDNKTLILRSRDPNNPSIVARTVVNCSYRMFCASSGNSTRLTVAGLTIRNGYNSLDGGAIWHEGGELKIINCTFADNACALQGGAICLRNGSASLTGCTFSGNASQSSFGGAIFCSNSRLNLAHCTLEGNTESALETHDSQVILTDCTFQGNSGKDGGAIHSRDDAAEEMAPTLDLTRCTFSENTSDSCGGALYLFRTAATLSACTFSANVAGHEGGALYSYGTDPSVSNCVFVRNTAINLGGALANLDGGRDAVSIRHCTFVSNSAAAGGALAGILQGQALISHSIFWQNAAAQGCNVSLTLSVWSSAKSVSAIVEYTDMEGGQEGIYVGPNCELDWLSGNIDADPLFLQGDDWNLSVGSPCLDAGNPVYSPGADATDLAGHPRLSGAAVDLGAYESSLGPVYRFWSPLTERHFYTMSRGERDKLIQDYPEAWTYEGIAFYASARPLDNMVAVHRLWSASQCSHFWTTDEQEYQRLLVQSPGLWTYERIAFYVYPPFKQPWGAVPVHRFWWAQRGGYFYTASEAEKDKLLKDTKTWTYQGVVWYAFPDPGR